MEKEKKKINLEIELRIKKLVGKDGKQVYVTPDPVKCPKCQFDIVPSERRKEDEAHDLYDSSALLQLLSFYDSKKSTIIEYKMFLKTRDVVETAFKGDAKKLELSLDEASFLKKFLEGLFDADRKPEEKISMPVFLGKTLVYILEQLEG